ncbi:MAG: hypothetical protein ACRD36_12710, partial [Candidatus Acidiferrum sp.]
MLDRIISSLVALSLALLVWLYARSRDQEILDNVAIPVQITLAANQADAFSMEVGGASQVLVSFTGPPTRIRELRGILQRSELHVDVTVSVPEERLNESRFSDTVVIESTDVHSPPGVTPIMVEGRNRIPIILHRLVERRLPVRFNATEDYSNITVTIDPPTVLVRGPQELLDRAFYIPTQPAELPARQANLPPTAPASSRVSMVQELESRAVQVTPAKVTILVPPQTRKIYELPEVAVHFLCPANFLLRPGFTSERGGRISLRLLGPAQDEPPRVYAFVDLTRGRFISGLNHEPLQLQLPKDFQ